MTHTTYHLLLTTYLLQVVLQLYRLSSPLPTARHLLIRLMGHLVRRRYSQKQPCRNPAELVPLSQPLAAQLEHPNKKRTWAGGRVQLGGQRLACSVSQQEALRERLRQARASRETWTPKQWERVVKEIGAEEWGAMGCKPLAAQPEHPNKKRTWAGVRVQLCGQRIGCSVSQREALRERLRQERAGRETWTSKQWERVVQQIGREDWGVVAHGGVRTKKALKLKHSAVGEHAIVASALDGKPMAKVPSDVVERSHSAVGEKGREVGQMAGSAVGEEQAREEDMSSAIAECGSPGDSKLPPTLPPLHIAKQRIAGYRVIEIINSGSFGDVYKAVKNSSGELFAIKVMQKCRKTAKMTTEQQRELSIMKGLSKKHDHIMNLLGWRETVFNLQLFMPLYAQTLRQFIKGGAVPLQAGKTIMFQLCSAVAYLHGCRIMHRDIKPANILMEHQPLAVVLSDFGASREILPVGLDQEPKTPVTPGMVTLWYRAPEILMGQTYAFPSDVWSTGITLVEVEQGHPPFRQNSEISMIADICIAVGGSHSKKARVDVRKQLLRWGQRYGTSFQDLVETMLVLSPEHRTSAQAASRHAFLGCQPLAMLASSVSVTAPLSL